MSPPRRDHRACRQGTTITTTRARGTISPDEFRDLAQSELDGLATADEAELLATYEDAWVTALRTLLGDVEGTIERARESLRGVEREYVVADFTEERERIAQRLAELTGAELPTLDEDAADGSDHTADEVADDTRDELLARTRLQLSWTQGAVLAWAAGHEGTADEVGGVLDRLVASGCGKDAWEEHEPVALPHGGHAPALRAPVRAVLGWLVGLGSTAADDELGASVTWMGQAAGLAVRLVAQGRMVPQLQRDAADGNGKRSTFRVTWEPTNIDHDELTELARAMPGTVKVVAGHGDPNVVTRDVLGGFVDAICREAASRVEVPAPPPQPRTSSDVAEAVLGRLDGSEFVAPTQSGSEVARGLQTWARGITGSSPLSLAVQLDPPDEGDAWYLKTLVTGGSRRDERVEAAMSRAKEQRREQIKRELDRLEGLYEPLERGKHRRRGEVVLSQDEAWELMTTVGPTLVAAGFEVRVPPMKPSKATPTLRVTSTGTQQSVVGAQQLTAVQWSAVVEGVELTAEEIRRLSEESQPLVRSSEGQWVAVDHADLEAAAQALAERADRGRMSGAEMLRLALGLDGSALGAPVSIAGEGWAADLLRAAEETPSDPPTSPEGFRGELRGYQAEALAWLAFLDRAGLGGCLALDMGLGKTPTMLAHLRRTRDAGPALVIAPPAVVGNWASEAQRFVPELSVRVHHGTNRADESELEEVAGDVDVLITTYGTALRDIGGLARVEWGSVVLDEAQVIKNPASETAQALRRLEARTRVVLTGTPIENGLGDLWALMDFVNPGLVGDRATFVAQMSKEKAGSSTAEQALRALNGVLVFRRTKAEPAIAAELPDRIDSLDRCPMTPEQVGLYQAVLDRLVAGQAEEGTGGKRKGAVLAAITALKQICNHPAAYTGDDGPLQGRSGKLERLEEIVDNVFESGERVLIFTHFATWGERLAQHLARRTGRTIDCYHGGLARGARDRMVERFQREEGPGALVLSLKAGGTGLNLTAASHVVLYDRWWNPAVEDQARDRAWRIGQTRTVVAHRLVCPGTVDERVEEVVAGKRRIADLALPESSSVDDLDSSQLQSALGIDADALLTDEFDSTRSEVAA